MLRELCNHQRKGQFTLIVNKCKKGHESGQEHVNNKGKLIPTEKIVSKKDCVIKCKFNCTR